MLGMLSSFFARADGGVIADLVRSHIHVRHVAQTRERKLPLSSFFASRVGGVVADLVHSHLDVGHASQKRERAPDATVLLSRGS